MSGPCVSAFKWVPPFAQGVVRDLRVRWALEEAGIDYQSQLLDFEEAKQPAYLRQQPFGQVPAFSDGRVEMFESGAIVLHIALGSPAIAARLAVASLGCAGLFGDQSWVPGTSTIQEPRPVASTTRRTRMREAVLSALR